MTTWLSSWRRLLTLTSVSFALFLALLAYRVSAGEDPALRASATPAAITQTATSASTTTDAAADAEEAAGAEGSTATTQSGTPTTQAS